MEQMKVFFEKAIAEKELMNKLDELGVKGAGDEEVIKLAAEYGFTITVEDIEAFRNQSTQSKILNEEDLENVAGGSYIKEDRHNHDICSQYTRTHYYCVGFLTLFPCVHYQNHPYPMIICHKGYFKFDQRYGPSDGKPK